MDSIDIVGFLFITINYFIIVPIFIYFLYQFYQYSKNSCFKDELHRSKTLIYLINIIIIFTILFERTFLLCSKVCIIIIINDFLIYLFISILWSFIMILFIIKVYHLYYKQEYNASIANMSWRKDINPTDQNWYISHKSTFGNTIFLIKLSIIPYIFIVLIETFVPIFIGSNLLFFIEYGFITSILSIIALYFFNKTKLFNDIYGIRHELLFQCIGLCLALFLYILITFIFSIIINQNNNNNNNINLTRIEWLCQYIISMIIAISIGLISTIYPIKLIKNKQKSNTLALSDISPDSDSKNDIKGYAEYIRNAKAMEFIISDYNSFKQFMQYLVKL